MIDMRQTEEFAAWLRDGRARARILIRMDGLALDNPSDVTPVGEGVSEMRIDYSPS